MLRCQRIGNDAYLMVSLQEPCFKGRHLDHVLMLTLPQIILYVIGLPLAGTMLLLHNKDRLHEKSFYTRYGLLYLGYRDERAWWELVVALRKVAIVSVGTFGTLLGVVDVQAHLALLMVFVSIVVHLLGKPFDMTRANTRLLHNLELTALCICWLTLWSGLLFFLGDEKAGSVDDGIIFLTVFLVAANVFFLLGSMVLFGKEYLKDRKKQILRRSTSGVFLGGSETQIVPVQEGAGNKKDEEEEQDEVRFAILPSYDQQIHEEQTHEQHVHAIHAKFDHHERALEERTRKGQQRQKRKTQLRVQARRKLKDSRALHQIDAFSDLDDDDINLLIDKMEHITRFKDMEICHQHDESDSFYIIVKGSAIVTVDVDQEEVEEEEEEDKNTTSCRTLTQSCPEQLQVATLETLGYFGESALLEHGERSATVTVSSERCDLLQLSNTNFLKIMNDNQKTFQNQDQNNKSVLDHLKEKQLERMKSNHMQLKRSRSSLLHPDGSKHVVVVAVAEDAKNQIQPPERPKGVPPRAKK